tara:strand:+ start:681 stop:962 length:282 start_codon:yes stop_codon:yes gene_type:complete
MPKTIRVRQAIEIVDDSNKKLQAETKFADWFLDIIEKGWVRSGNELSELDQETKYAMLFEALNSEPKGLASFRKNDKSYNNYGMGRNKTEVKS